MKPVVFRTPEELKTWRLEKHATVGFVPTMGALHSGHESLLQKARAENDIVVLSIFVNPTQFNDKNDFEKYPNTWESDVAIAERHRVDAIFHPGSETMYPEGYRYRVTENELSQMLCGKSRPGHFDGVLTVVMKLLNIVQPTRAYFGEKDYQQLSLVQGMVSSFFLPYQIIAVPTVRESTGLALSSRNLRLNPQDHLKAAEIYRALTESGDATQAQRRLLENGFDVDYVEDFQGRRYAAARVGEVRLIDNVEI